MKATRNRRGRFHNPQPALFLGLKDAPGQALLFDSTDPDPEPAQHWKTLFDEPFQQVQHALCRQVADGFLVIETGETFDMLRAKTRANETDYRSHYEIVLTAAKVGAIIDEEGEEVYP